MIGIDLGTTNCTLAIKGENGIQNLPISQQISSDMEGEKTILPSFYFFPLEGEPCIGWYAKQRGAELPDRMIASAKSWLCHHAIERRSSFLPLGEFKEKRSPVTVCTAYLKHLRQLVSDEQKVVVTVPASFDPSARQLVQEITESAGFKQATFLEEPLAAFYAWLYRHEHDWRTLLKVGDTVLVVDIGGGTTDFSIISVEQSNGELSLEREAVGDHLLLGGDNIDLALAHLAQNKLDQEIDEWQFQNLVHQVRSAKETLLGIDPPDTVDLSIQGKGSRLIGGALHTTLKRAEVESLLVEGFFPIVDLNEQILNEKSSGIANLTLPYTRDPRITAQLAHFLSRSETKLPNIVLFNGGTMKALAFQNRLLHILSKWSGQQVKALSDPDFDFGVSQGAVYYGMLQENNGIRIRAGTSRSYFIGVEKNAPAVPGIPQKIKPICVVPKGMEEGTECTLVKERFSLILGESVQFRFFSQGSEEEPLIELHPIETILHSEDTQENVVLVTLTAKITELGVLELWCIAENERRWKLEFDIRNSQ